MRRVRASRTSPCWSAKARWSRWWSRIRSWCGRPGLLNARVEDGVVAREGAQFVVGDTAEEMPADEAPAEIRYQVLCRRHHRTGDLGPAANLAGQLRLV